MEYRIDKMVSDDWDQVRSIYLDGIGIVNGTWRDVVLMERRSKSVGID